MRSFHLTRGTAALLLVPALLAAGALHDEPLRPPAVPEVGTATMGRTAGVAPTPWVTSAVSSAVTSPELPETPAPGRGRQGALRRADRQRPSVQDRGRAALASLRYDWRALGYQVRFLPYDGHGLGSANRRTRLITVYVRPGQSELSLRASLAHELGHALDFEHGTADRRDAYRRIRGLPATSRWFPCDRCDDYASPAGDFAEVFALWLVGPGDFRSRLQGPPDRQQLKDLAGLFELPRAHQPSPAPAPAPEPDEEPEDETVVAAVLDPLETPPPGT